MEGSDRQRQCHVRQSDRSGPEHRASDDRSRTRRSFAQDYGGRAGRDSRAEGHHQHDGGPAQRVCLRSHPRRPRSRNGRPARRTGAGPGRRRHVEGPDRQRQLDGRQPDRSGPEYRRGGDGDRRRRPVQEDHRQRQRRNPAVERDHQHDGRPTQPLCRRSDARRARSRNRGPARRPGQRHGRRRHLEGSDGERQLDGVEPDGAGAQHRRSFDGDRRWRPVQEDHRQRQRRDLAA